MMLRRSFLCCLVVCLFAAPQLVYGYLDPATGSMALQMAVGGLVAAIAVVRIYWKKLRSLFCRTKSAEEAGDSNSAPLGETTEQ